MHGDTKRCKKFIWSLWIVEIFQIWRYGSHNARFLYHFLEKTQVVWVCAQSEHTRLRLLAETFDTTHQTTDPALTFSGDFYFLAPILCSLYSDKYVFLFYFSLRLNLSFKNCPLFCVLILHCIADAVFVFFFYNTFGDAFSRAHERKNTFKSMLFLQKNTFLPDVYDTMLDESFPVLQKFTRRGNFQLFPLAKRCLKFLAFNDAINNKPCT
jgi:hypothetical protein